jgi:hypothetical protein
MAQSTAEWHVVKSDGELAEFETVIDLLAELARAPAEFQPHEAENIAAAVAAAPRNVGVDAGNNQVVVFGPGCTSIAAGSNITSVEVSSLVILSRAACNAFAPPFLALWPTAPGTPTRRPVPTEWQQTARSALAWY